MEYETYLDAAKQKVQEFVNEWMDCDGARDEDFIVDFSDLSKIPVAFTTLETREENEIQIYVNLDDYQILTFVDGSELKRARIQCDDAEDFLQLFDTISAELLVSLDEDDLRGWAV